MSWCRYALVALAFLLTAAPRPSTATDRPERRVAFGGGVGGFVRVLVSADDPAARAGAGLVTQLNIALRLTSHVAVGAQVGFGIFDFAAGPTLDISPCGWSRHGLLLSLQPAFYRSMLSCDECEHHRAEVAAALGEVSVSYRWVFGNGSSLSAGATASGALAQAIPAARSGLYLGGAGPRITFQY